MFSEKAKFKKVFCKEKASLYLNVWWSQAEKPPNIELSHGFYSYRKHTWIWHFPKIIIYLWKTTSNHTEFTPGLMHERAKNSKQPRVLSLLQYLFGCTDFKLYANTLLRYVTPLTYLMSVACTWIWYTMEGCAIF